MILGYTLMEKFKKEMNNNKTLIYENILNAIEENNIVYIKQNINKININLKDEEDNTFLDLIVSQKPKEKALKTIFKYSNKINNNKLNNTLLYSAKNKDENSFQIVFNNISEKKNIKLKDILNITNDKQILKILLNNKEIQKQISLNLFKELEKKNKTKELENLIKIIKIINPNIFNKLLHEAIEDKNKKAISFLLNEINPNKKFLKEFLTLNKNDITFLLEIKYFKELLNKLSKEELEKFNLKELSELKNENNNLKFI